MSVVVALVASAGCGDAPRSSRSTMPNRPGVSIVTTPQPTATSHTSGADAIGHDAQNIPYYSTRTFTAADSLLLRRVWGIEHPSLLYVSDSTSARLVKYDLRRKRCARCYVDTERIGFVSLRRPGESWSTLEARVRHTRLADFPASVHVITRTIDAMDPEAQPAMRRMLLDADRAGFHVHVRETYRSPEREAYLMALGGYRTHTLTSLHSYGRALDVSIDDGDRVHTRTRADWIAFRRWVRTYRGGMFHLIGTPAHSWDWAHVELPSARVGFRSIPAVLAAARSCEARGRLSCDFPPNLPPLVDRNGR